MIGAVLLALLGQMTVYDHGAKKTPAGGTSIVNCTGNSVSCWYDGAKWQLKVNFDGGTSGGGGVSSVTASSPLASSGGSTPNISLAGTVSQARGGTGAGALTCTSGQALTSNGSAYSCTSSLTADDLSCTSCVSSGEIVSVTGAQVSSAVATATALASNPADCGANTYATTIAATGDLTCSQVSLTAGVTGTLPQANGGTGAGATTCSAKYALTSNGTAISCTNSLAGGNPSEVQWNSAGALGGISNFTSDGIVPILGEDAGTVATPSAGAALYEQRFTMWLETRTKDANGITSTLQKSLMNTQWGIWLPSGSSNINCFGVGCSSGQASTTGTITQEGQVFGGDDWVKHNRFRLQTAASTNTNAYALDTGNANGDGPYSTNRGFECEGMFNTPRVNATARYFVGVRDAVASPFNSIDPTAILEGAGAMVDAAGTNWKLCSSGPDAGQGCTDCGSSFAVRDAGTGFTLRMVVPPGGAFIGQHLTKESTGETCQRLATTTVPAQNYALMRFFATNTGSTAAANNLDGTHFGCRAISP